MNDDTPNPGEEKPYPEPHATALLAVTTLVAPKDVDFATESWALVFGVDKDLRTCAGDTDSMAEFARSLEAAGVPMSASCLDAVLSTSVSVDGDLPKDLEVRQPNPSTSHRP